MSDPREQLDTIRRERANGELLGPLQDKYGAAAVVEALGVMHVAGSLGLLDDEPEDEEGP